MNIIGRRRLWFVISLLIIIPGTYSLLRWGLKAGIEFTGGQVMEVTTAASQADIRRIFESEKMDDVTVVSSGGNRYTVRYRQADGTDTTTVAATLKTNLSSIGAETTSFESIGPSVSRDITRNAIISVALASLVIVAFVALAFRNTPPPVSPLSFGVTAVIALLHDSLALVGIFSLLGHFAGVEVDSLFVTAVLTVIGFSVHDTIVVYDRIRENLKRSTAEFSIIVNDSIIETLGRSLGTSLTVLLTLLALFLFGGETIHYFVLALLIGVLLGTFSSILNAAPMLVVWHNRKLRRIARKATKPVKAAKVPKKKS